MKPKQLTVLILFYCRNIYENFTDRFRNTWLSQWNRFSCTPNNNLYARLQHNRFKQTIVSARGGGDIEATKRLLTQLPIPSQSYSNSPYLDFSIFSYDDKWVSMLERPKGKVNLPWVSYFQFYMYILLNIFSVW